MISLSVSSVVFSYAGAPMWTSFFAAVTHAVVAWEGFTKTRAKLERYNQAVMSMNVLLLWWSSLSQVEKAIHSNKAKLVMECEAIMAQEYNAWKSTLIDNNEEEEEQAEGGSPKKAGKKAGKAAEQK